MKGKMKRLFSILLTVILVGTMTVGCGKKQGEKYTSTSTGTVLVAMIAISAISANPKRAMMLYDRFATESELSFFQSVK